MTILGYSDGDRICMRQQAPPLDATEAFLAAARAPSFRAAADEIALSPSAFSRRIQLLEAFVGAPLFDRSGPSSKLTNVGLRYYQEVAPALDAIRSATQRMRDDASRRRLRVATSHSLAVGWLVPRLPNLERELGIHVDLTISRDQRLLSAGEIDVAVWGGIAAEPGIAIERLISLEAMLAGAPELPDGSGLPPSMEDLPRHRALAARAPEGFWATWLIETDLHGRGPSETVYYDTTHLAYEGAAAGMGLALVVPMLADRFIAEGRLLPAFARSVSIGHDYSVFFATADIARRGPVRDLVEWLERQVAGSGRSFAAWAKQGGLDGDNKHMPISGLAG